MLYLRFRGAKILGQGLTVLQEGSSWVGLDIFFLVSYRYRLNSLKEPLNPQPTIKPRWWFTSIGVVEAAVVHVNEQR